MRLGDFLALFVVCTLFSLFLYSEGVKITVIIVFFLITLALTCSTLNYLNHSKFQPFV